MAQYSGGVHICAAGESFDGLALAFFGDERYACDIMNGNPQYCGMVTFRGGEVITLPNIDVPEDDEEEAMANTIAPWKV